MTNDRERIIQQDLEGTASHLDQLVRMLRGQAVFLSRSRLVDSAAEINHIQQCLAGLSASIIDLRDVAENISKVA